MAGTEKSLRWVLIMVMITIAVFGWGFLAGSWAGAHATPLSEMPAGEREDLDTRSPGSARRQAGVAFFANAIRQLPNMPAVLTWHLSNRVWLPISIILLEVAALGGGYAMSRVESSLQAPRKPRR